MILTLKQYGETLQTSHGIDPFEQAMEHNSEKCTCCQIVLQEATTGYRRIDGKPYCSDDYFFEFGNELEKNPIGGHRS